MIPPDFRAIICGATDQAETGVIDEDLHLLAGCFDVGHQLCRRIRLRKIGGDRASIPELASELVEPLLAARGEYQPVTTLRQLPGEFDAQPRRGTGDQRDL